MATHRYSVIDDVTAHTFFAKFCKFLWATPKLLNPSINCYEINDGVISNNDKHFYLLFLEIHPLGVQIQFWKFKLNCTIRSLSDRSLVAVSFVDVHL